MTIIKLLNPRYSSLMGGYRFHGTDDGFYQMVEQLKQAKEIVTKNKEYMDKVKKEKFSFSKKDKTGDSKKEDSKKDSRDNSKKLWGKSWTFNKNRRSGLFKYDDKSKDDDKSSGKPEKDKKFEFSRKDVKKVLSLMTKSDKVKKEKPVPPGQVMRTSKQAIAAKDKMDSGKTCYRCNKPGHMMRDCKEEKTSGYKTQKSILALMKIEGLTCPKQINEMWEFMSDIESDSGSDVVSDTAVSSESESNEETSHMPDSIRQEEIMKLLENYGATPEEFYSYVEQFQEN